LQLPGFPMKLTDAEYSRISVKSANHMVIAHQMYRDMIQWSRHPRY